MDDAASRARVAEITQALLALYAEIAELRRTVDAKRRQVRLLVSERNHLLIRPGVA